MIDTLLLSLLSFYSASQGASFDSAKTPVARGLAHYWNGEYELTVEALAPSCPEESDLGERLECYQYLAFSWVALGEEDRAQEAFVELLSSDPAFRIAPELVAPKILKRFDDATHRLATEWFGQA
jgi:tetratricopeptide (TPR) repeat protein